MATEKIVLQGRDSEIFKFLDRVGYANLAQIARFVGNGEKSESGILQRLYALRRFGYLRTETTHRGFYFFLSYKGKGNNPLIFTFKLDQLLHHDFLTELFFLVHGKVEVLSERECIAKFKAVGKKGNIPDMVIGDWIIEFERTNKSVADCKAVVDYWTVTQGRKLCVIYENNEIRNRYASLANPRVRLLAKDEYKSVMEVLAAPVATAQTASAVPTPSVAVQPPQHSAALGAAKPVDTVNKQYVESVKNKYS